MGIVCMLYIDTHAGKTVIYMTKKTLILQLTRANSRVSEYGNYREHLETFPAVSLLKSKRGIALTVTDHTLRERPSLLTTVSLSVTVTKCLSGGCRFFYVMESL